MHARGAGGDKAVLLCRCCRAAGSFCSLPVLLTPVRHTSDANSQPQAYFLLLWVLVTCRPTPALRLPHMHWPPVGATSGPWSAYKGEAAVVGGEMKKAPRRQGGPCPSSTSFTFPMAMYPRQRGRGASGWNWPLGGCAPGGVNSGMWELKRLYTCCGRAHHMHLRPARAWGVPVKHCEHWGPPLCTWQHGGGPGGNTSSANRWGLNWCPCSGIPDGRLALPTERLVLGCIDALVLGASNTLQYTARSLPQVDVWSRTCWLWRDLLSWPCTRHTNRRCPVQPRDGGAGSPHRRPAGDGAAAEGPSRGRRCPRQGYLGKQVRAWRRKGPVLQG